LYDRTSRKPVPKIFVSATSKDLGSVRKIAVSALQKLGCLAVEQDTFEPDYRTLEALLEHKISGCDAFIQFVGHRYGAEPNADSRPKDEKRRSYTQMEYDIAVRLKKKVYLFVCADGFPYDECAPEDDENRDLQLQYRDSLRSSKTKRENVRDGAECESLILQLQLQIEELILILNKERRGRSLLTMAAILTGLSVLGTLYYISRHVQDISGESVQAIESISQQIGEMTDSDLLTEISERSKVDPGMIRQTLTQFKNQKADSDIFSFSSNLLDNGRPELVSPLMRFVAEAAVSAKEPDFLLAAKSLELAGRALEVQLKGTRDKEDGKAIATLRVDVLQRALDAFEAITPELKLSESDVKVRLVMGVADSLQDYAMYLEPIGQKDAISKAVNCLRRFEPPPESPFSQRVDYHLTKAIAFERFAEFQECPEEKAFLHQSLQEAEAAKQLSVQEHASEYHARALRRMARVKLRMMQTACIVESRELFNEICRICDECERIPPGGIKDYRIEIELTRAIAALDLSKISLKPEETETLLDEASEMLQQLERSIPREGEEWLSRLFMEQWIRLRILSDGDYGEYDGAMERHIKRGFTSDMAQASMFVEWLGEQRGSSPEEFEPAIEYIVKMIDTYPRGVAPRIHSRARLLLNDLYCWKAKSRFSGARRDDIEIIERNLETIQATFDRNHYPAIWASTRIQLLYLKVKNLEPLDKELLECLEAAEEISIVATAESDPYLLADAHELVADICLKVHPPQVDRAIEALESGIEIYKREHVADKVEAFTETLDDARKRKSN
jgi:hypothetical protein